MPDRLPIARACAFVVLCAGCNASPLASQATSGGADFASVIDAVAWPPDLDDGMAPVGAGAFYMGCTLALDPDCQPEEMPRHQVLLSAYRIDRQEASQAQYAACIAAGACTTPLHFDLSTGPDVPANIDWNQATAYCRWAGRRLPTEAEWEKAARGLDERRYPWGNEPPDCSRANILHCGNRLDPVDSHWTGASPYGAVNMEGNVGEWVSDFYDPAYYQVSPATAPQGPASGPFHNHRGASYDGSGGEVRAASRLTRLGVAGVRCARDGG